MAKISLYHGTSMEAASNILKDGFKESGATWTLSDGEKIYFYRIIKRDGYSFAANKNIAIESAFQNGCIAASLRKSKAEYVSVLEISIDESLVCEDISCENTSIYGACQVNIGDLNKIKINERKCKYYPGLSLMYLQGVTKELNLNSCKITKDELRLIENLGEKSNTYEMLHERESYK